MSMPPPVEVLAAYGFDSNHQVEPLTGGLINTTLLVRDESRVPVAVLQALHPVFGAKVNLDLEAVTNHLAAHGLPTPRLLRTVGGDAWVPVTTAEREVIWRAISYVEGETFAKVPSLAHAEAAGALVGRVHVALADFDYEYRFARAGVHDTAAHLARLRAAVDAHRGNAGLDAVIALGDALLTESATLPSLAGLPLRHTHGDLKISNLLFAPDKDVKALCLVDLDTFGKQPLAYELGDALRSWCNPAGEDVAAPEIDISIYQAAMRGYRDAAGELITDAELASIPLGLETICFELASRFCLDAIEDRYFGWDASRFASRREHNLLRARGQLALGRSVRAATALR